MTELTGAQYTNIFATPLMAHRWSDAEALNAALLPAILAYERQHPGLSKTNMGGWHSPTGRLEFCGEAGQQLVRHMVEMADNATLRLFHQFRQRPQPVRWTLEAWVNINRAGEYNRHHTHPGSSWSGTYYVDAGDPPPESEAGTPLHLFDSGHGQTFPFVPSSFLIRPEAGLMVLFPSYVPHMVYPHKGGRPRVSIAFNLRKEPFP